MPDGQLPPAERDSYIDLWRAAALVRVVVYHATGLAWLTIAFPAMGIMFALAGSLTARSLARPARHVIVSRLRRLLPPVWVFGAVAVGITAWGGWGDVEHLPEKFGLVWWVVPLKVPSVGGANFSWAFTGVLWYLVAYIWFALLSPVLLRIFRAWPLWTLGVSLAIPILLHLDLLTIGGYLEYPGRDLATYGCCWLLGFAHNDGLLRQLPARIFTVAVCVVAAAGVAMLFLQAPRVGTYDLNHLPFANALWSAAFVAVVLRWQPSSAGTRSGARTGPVVRALNARAVTIYLWHFPCVFLARELAIGYGGAELSKPLPAFVLVLAVTIAAVAVFGWVEDLAAKRPVRILPLVRSDPDRRSAARHRGGRSPRWTDLGHDRPATAALLGVGVLAVVVSVVAAVRPVTALTQSDERQPGYDEELLVSELPFTSVQDGHGPVERNQSVGGSGVDDGTRLVVAGTPFDSGLGVHAPSLVRVHAVGRCSRFTATVGLDETDGRGGSVRFVVLADGLRVFDSGRLTDVRETVVIDVQLDGVERLDLAVEDDGDGDDGDAADWAGATLWCRS